MGAPSAKLCQRDDVQVYPVADEGLMRQPDQGQVPHKPPLIVAPEQLIWAAPKSEDQAAHHKVLLRHAPQQDSSHHGTSVLSMPR